MKSALTAVAATLALAAPAAAQSPTPTPTPTPTPAPPAAAPQAAQLAIAVDRVGRLGKRSYALRGSSFRVRGTLTPFAAGEKVTVRFYRNGRKVKARSLVVHDAGNGSGRFQMRFASGRTGNVVVRASHRRSAALDTAVARAARVQVIASSASSGARGPVVRLLQAGLDRLRYAVPRTGVFDDGTARAVLAYRKVNGMPRTTFASKAIVTRVLARRGGFKPRHPDAGRHAEADLSRQVLALIDKGKVVRTYHISSGSPATPTIVGSFRVYLKTPGTNAKGMVHSNYFRGGYAVHGYASVPPYPASHGCLRVPIPNAMDIFRWLHLGDGVIVYP